jgi:hypothetical protein
VQIDQCCYEQTLVPFHVVLFVSYFIQLCSHRQEESRISTGGLNQRWFPNVAGLSLGERELDRQTLFL